MARIVLSPGDDRFPRANENGGDDVVIGRGGDDTIFGGAGDDDLRGGRGNDDLRGNGGDDTLAAGPSSNVLTGGAGADRFVIESNPLPLDGRSDTIRDFSEAEGDVIEINCFEIDNFREFRGRADDSQDIDGNGLNDTVVPLNRGESLVILDTTLAELRGDVLFG